MHGPPRRPGFPAHHLDSNDRQPHYDVEDLSGSVLTDVREGAQPTGPAATFTRLPAPQ
jgi:hypothetical protein